jgi:hypothetical protein
VLNLGRGWVYCLPRSTTRHTRPFSVARGDRQVHCGSRGYCGRQDARADSLHTGLQPFTCDEVVAVTRAARQQGSAHCPQSPFAKLDQRAKTNRCCKYSALAALPFSCCDSCPSQRSTPRVTSGRGISEQSTTGGTGKRADLARARSRRIER